ncbi:MAG TPA: hypothetical protein VMU87_02345 [Stellaceae bacterium]|nr:hypothetical protein [Stellaceae bacterium]
MAMAALFRRRVFRHPFRSATESTGVHSMLFALVSGPIYYWRKRARIEAVVLGIASIPPLLYNPATSLVSRAVLNDAVTLIWAGAVVFAPALLALSYRRQGWIEIGESG